MENENIRENENLQEEASVEIPDAEINEVQENVVEEAPLDTEEIVATVETAETEAEESIIEEPEANEEIAEVSEDDVIGDEWKTEDMPEEDFEEVPELSEEELAALAMLKRKRRNKGILITAIIAAVIAILAYFVCAIEGVGSNTIVSKPLVAAEMAEDASALKKALATDNIKFENPIVALFDKVTGRNKDVVMTVGDEKITKDIMTFITNSTGLNNAYSLLQMQLIASPDKMDWNAVDEKTGLTYLELSKGMGFETLMPMYALIGEGKKNGVELTEEDKKSVDAWIAEQKETYGDEFEEILKKSGYDSIDTLKEIQTIQLYTNKIYEDVMKDITKYISPEQQKAYLGDDKVTVKHILVQFEKDEEGNITDGAKAAAKKEAEEVLAKVKAGEDFDKLIEQYNDDPGATDEGYTFAQDGSMVKEFEDAAFALEIGKTSELVETTYGYHILKRLERKMSAEEYIEMLRKTVDVRVKKSVYNDVKVTINLNDYLGAPEETEDQAETEPTAE